MFLDDIHQAFCQNNTRNLWTYLFAVFWKNYLAHWLICCFGILLPSYSISGCCTIPPCCTGRRRWPQKLLHLPSWMTPRWLHTIRKAGDVKNGWHKYNYVIHTGCMVKKNRSKTPTFWKIINLVFCQVQSSRAFEELRGHRNLPILVAELVVLKQVETYMAHGGYSRCFI